MGECFPTLADPGVFLSMSSKLNLLAMADPAKIIFSSSQPKLVTISRSESYTTLIRVKVIKATIKNLKGRAAARTSFFPLHKIRTVHDYITYKF